MKRFALVVAAALALSGCASLGSVVSNVVVAATSKTPSQAKTVAEATQATTLAENAVDLYVKTGNPTKAVLSELQTLVTALHTALVKAEAANKSGNSAVAAAAIDAFNQALAAYQAYSVHQGVSS